MKKKPLVAGGIVAALLVAVLVAVSFFLGSIVKAGVNNYGPKITQTKVHLAAASISPFSGSGTLYGLVVGNPKGWSAADLVSLGRVHVSLDPGSLFGNHIVVKDIDVDAPEFDYETKLVSSNVGDLLSTVERSTGSSASSAKAKNGKAIRVEVRHFRLRNGTVRLGAGKAAVRIPLPTIELTNIGTGQGGVSPAQVTAEVLRSVTTDIVHASTHAAEAAGATAGAAAAQQLKNAAGKVKGLLKGKNIP